MNGMYEDQYATILSAEDFRDLTEKISDFFETNHQMKIVNVSYGFADNEHQALVVFEEK